MKPIDTNAGQKNARRTLLEGIGLLSLFSFFKWGQFSRKRKAIDCAPPDNKQTARLLSQDGQLVEVDLSKIKMLKKKISDQELQKWIRK